MIDVIKLKIGQGKLVEDKGIVKGIKLHDEFASYIKNTFYEFLLGIFDDIQEFDLQDKLERLVDSLKDLEEDNVLKSDSVRSKFDSIIRKINDQDFEEQKEDADVLLKKGIYPLRREINIIEDEIEYLDEEGDKVEYFIKIAYVTNQKMMNPIKNNNDGFIM